MMLGLSLVDMGVALFLPMVNYGLILITAVGSNKKVGIDWFTPIGWNRPKATG